jgi:hypothetical protein
MHITLFGKTNASGFPVDWTQETVVSVMGGVDLDLTKRPPAPGARLTVLHILGGTKINIPSGRRLSSGGLTILGRREIDVTPATGPDLTITVYNILGRVHVTESGPISPTP